MTKKVHSLFFVFLLIIGLIAWNDLPQAYPASGVISAHSQPQFGNEGKNVEEKSINKTSKQDVIQAINQAPLTNSRGSAIQSFASELSPGIILTFDDKSVDDWYSFLVLNNKYGVKATFYVSFFHTLNLNQLIELKLLQDAKNEIAYHTTNHVNALKYLKANSMDDYLNSEIFPDLNLMKEKGFRVQDLAYPYGAGNKELDQELLQYFKTVRYTAYPPKNKKIADFNPVYLKDKRQRVLNAVGIDNGYGHTDEEIFQGIDRAYNNHETLLLYGHVISNKPGNANTSMQRLETIIQYAQKKGMTFHTVSELGS
ncbi:MAG: hypothetical protein AWM53_00778 [Candidatus Dichloromethanomonas elyunquensis]|nr:MAG: hypothetical protein AWM53_00778 [Candidatus Dichloromethanomonas elyunquensis]